MIDIKFKINGRNVCSDQIGKEIERAALAHGKKQIQQNVSRIRCPVHGKTARVTTSAHDLSWKVEGCCDALIVRVKKALG